jgi:thiol-disulfide isomerase/thioredoxin
MNIQKLITGVVAGVMLASVSASVSAAPAPDFKLKSIDNKTVSLSDYKGKIVFLDFWASWCPPCRQSIPAVEKLHERFKGSDVVVLGINVEGDPEVARKFARKNSMTYPVLLGDNKTENAYRVRGFPAFFLIDQQGNIAKSYVGYHPGLEDTWAADIKALKEKAQK